MTTRAARKKKRDDERRASAHTISNRIHETDHRSSRREQKEDEQLREPAEQRRKDEQLGDQERKLQISHYYGRDLGTLGSDADAAC